ncbi:HD family hydrolase [Brenneria populi subsp. brevivirga]|uniref:HD family hydrolase n=1 Tax=Brenneria populi TaxID=1505588 RepID=UPI002E19B224|nr:HD family hydrolase [Brenneria populi subsp. brevivirga]
MSWISTYTGRHFNYTDPNLDSICLLDIAHSLSQINRFCGHTNWPYSVAQHSVGASYIVPQEFALEALMHDAHEAYVNDMMSPLKHMLPDYKSVETRIEQMVRLKFDLPLQTSPEVKHADLVMLATEKEALLHANSGEWPLLNGIEPSNHIIVPISPTEAKQQFISRFHELTAGQYFTVDYDGEPVYLDPPADDVLVIENAMQSLMLRNITQVLNLPGKKTISAEVIDLVNALTAENKELRQLAEKI